MVTGESDQEAINYTFEAVVARFMNGIFAKNAVYALIQLRDTLEFDKSIPTLDKDGLSRSITLISSSISLDKGIIYGRFDTNSDSTRAYFDSGLLKAFRANDPILFANDLTNPHASSVFYGHQPSFESLVLTDPLLDYEQIYIDFILSTTASGLIFGSLEMQC